MSNQLSDSMLEQFREELIRCGYAKSSVISFTNAARQYVESGNPLANDAARKYWKAYCDGNTKSGAYKVRYSGTKKFISFLNNQPFEVGKALYDTRKKTGKKWFGCDEDCFNCKYDDCYRPQGLVHKIRYE